MKPVDSVEVFAPATVANLGPGFDVLGLAIDGLGDRVRAKRIDGPAGVELVEITGDGGKLPTDVDKNTASVAAGGLAREVGIRVALSLHKGLPLASGLGSSAASAVAGAVATAAIAGLDLGKARLDLLPHCLAGEEVASGAGHADNVAPCLIGGATLVHSPDATPPGLIPLPVPGNLWIALAIPNLSLETSKARAALPKSIPLTHAVTACGRVAGLVAAFFRDDLNLVHQCLRDDIIEPVRSALIPGFDEVRMAAIDAGAVACSISGAGPTIFSLSASRENAMAVGDAMVEAWANVDVEARPHVAQTDRLGARVMTAVHGA